MERRGPKTIEFTAHGDPPLKVFAQISAPWLLLEAALEARDATGRAEGDQQSPPNSVVRHAAVCVVLAVAALEGYINNFAQRHIDSWLWRLVDRSGKHLELHEKWRAAPKLSGGASEFPTNADLWSRFRRLVRLRNETLHWQPPEPDTGSALKAWGERRQTVATFTADCATEACRTACEMIWQLHELHESSLLPGWGEILDRVEGPWQDGVS